MIEEFEITELHTRFGGELNEESGESEFFELTLEFIAHDDYLFDWCVRESNDYKEVDTVTSIEEHEKYLDTLVMDFNDDGTITFTSTPTFEQVHKKLYSYNTTPILKKIDERKFCFHDYVESTPTTLAALKELKDIKDSGISYSQFTNSCVIMRLLQTFDIFWH